MNKKARLAFFSAILSCLLVSCATAPKPPLDVAPSPPASQPFAFKYLSCLAADGQGRIYAIDRDLGAVVRIDDMKGAKLSSFGTKGYGPGRFAGLELGLALDNQGRIYLSDFKTNRLIRIDDLAGSGWTELDLSRVGVSYPSALAVDAAGRIYIADGYTSRLVRIDSMSGEGQATFGSEGSGIGQLVGPSSLAIDPSGGIYIADKGNRRVVHIDDFSGAGWTSYDGADSRGGGAFTEPSYIFLGPGPVLWVSDTASGRILALNGLSPVGRRVWGWDGVGARPYQPCGICVDRTGILVFADAQGRRLCRVPDLASPGFEIFPAEAR